MLNRIVTWQASEGETMIAYEADPRHAEIIVKNLGMSNATSLSPQPFNWRRETKMQLN